MKLLKIFNCKIKELLKIPIGFLKFGGPPPCIGPLMCSGICIFCLLRLCASACVKASWLSFRSSSSAALPSSNAARAFRTSSWRSISHLSAAICSRVKMLVSAKAEREWSCANSALLDSRSARTASLFSVSTKSFPRARAARCRHRHSLERCEPHEEAPTWQ